MPHKAPLSRHRDAQTGRQQKKQSLPNPARIEAKKKDGTKDGRKNALMQNDPTQRSGGANKNPQESKTRN